MKEENSWIVLYQLTIKLICRIITHGKLIKQRNKILKYFNKSAKVDMDSILIYDEQIIKLSEPIHKCRKKICK